MTLSMSRNICNVRQQRCGIVSRKTKAVLALAAAKILKILDGFSEHILMEQKRPAPILKKAFEMVFVEAQILEVVRLD